MNSGNYRKYSYKTPIKKLILAQFGAAMLAIMTSMPTVTLGDGGRTLEVVTSAIAVFFLLYLQYTAMWDIAAKDRISIDGGRLKEDKLVGLKSALLASIPTYVITFIAIALRGIFLLSKADAIGSVSTITYAADLLWNYMYHGVLVLFVPSSPNSPLFLAYLATFIALTAPSLITCYIAYNQGLKGKRILPEKKNNR